MLSAINLRNESHTAKVSSAAIALLKAFEGGYVLERFTRELNSSLIAKGKVCTSLRLREM
jgi:hypothetical protein